MSSRLCHRCVTSMGPRICLAGNWKDDQGGSWLFCGVGFCTGHKLPSLPSPLCFVLFERMSLSSNSTESLACGVRECVTCIFALVPRADGKGVKGAQ